MKEKWKYYLCSVEIVCHILTSLQTADTDQLNGGETETGRSETKGL
jgi:hypothetical protein